MWWKGLCCGRGTDHWANERRRIENHMGHCRSIDRKNLGTRERVPKLISLRRKVHFTPHAHGLDAIVKAKLENKKRRDHQVQGK